MTLSAWFALSWVETWLLYFNAPFCHYLNDDANPFKPFCFLNRKHIVLLLSSYEMIFKKFFFHIKFSGINGWVKTLTKVIHLLCHRAIIPREKKIICVEKYLFSLSKWPSTLRWRVKSTFLVKPIGIIFIAYYLQKKKLILIWSIRFEFHSKS